MPRVKGLIAIIRLTIFSAAAVVGEEYSIRKEGKLDFAYAFYNMQCIKTRLINPLIL